MQKVRQLTLFLLLGFLSILLSACAGNGTNLEKVNTANYSELENVHVVLRGPSSNRTSLSALRVKSLEDSAMSIGAQGGLAWASDKINARTSQDRKYLDAIFNFNALVLAHGVMPPVLEEGDTTLNLADPNTIRISDRTYKIVQQAHFATTPPNWRDYIILSFSKPALPDKTLLPKSSEEVEIWKKGIRRGWDKGIEQSYSIFQQNMACLKRDFRVMLLY